MNDQVELKEDIQVMYRYVLENGIDLSGSQLEDIAKFRIDSLGEVQLLQLHRSLVSLVSPTTPASLRATERVGTGWRINNSTNNILVVGTLVSLVLYVGTSVLWARMGEQVQYLAVIQLIFAAGVGAGFYSLWTAHKYIKNRTFDPQYNQLYLIRFVLGIVAGTILGYSMTDIFAGTAGQLQPSLLAIVGGYSADAVAQILQRLADTLVTIVKGNDSDSNEVERAKIRSKLNEETSKLEAEFKDKDAKRKQELVKKAMKLKDGTSEEATLAVQEMIDDLLDESED